jgi:tetratricopeptide (TPR) repeat protein
MLHTEPDEQHLRAYLALDVPQLFHLMGQYSDTTRGNFFEPHLAELRRAICDEWNWSERRQDARLSDPFNLALAVMDALICAHTRIPFPFSLTAAVLVKTGLDALCPNAAFNWSELLNEDLDEIRSRAQTAFYGEEHTVLLTVPDSLLDRCWTELKSNPSNDDAARILFYTFVTRFNNGSIEAGCQLKALYDLTLDHIPTIHTRIAQKLHEKLAGPFIDRIRQRRIPDSMLDHNPLDAMVQCYLSDPSDVDSCLIGGLLMVEYRASYAAVPDGAINMAFSSLFEARAFHLGGKHPLADGSIQFAIPRLEKLRDSFPAELSTLIGGMFCAVAGAARKQGYYENQLELLERALTYLIPGSNEYSDTWYSIGQEHERCRRYDDALAAYDRGLAAPGLTEPILRAALQNCRSGLKFHSEGDFSAFGEGSRNYEGTALPPELLHKLTRLVEAMQSGVELTDQDYLELIGIQRQLITFHLQTANCDDHLLGAYTRLIKAGLSLRDPTTAPFDYGTILVEASRHVDRASEPERMAFELVASLLYDAGLTPRP